MASCALQARGNSDGVEFVFQDDCGTHGFQSHVEPGVPGLHQLADDIDRVLGRARCHGGGCREDYDELFGLGRELTNRLVPVDLRDKLSSTAGCPVCLDIDPALGRLPWELLLVDDQFFCLLSGVGRVSRDSTRSAAIAPEPVELPLTMGVVANPAFDLPAASREADSLRRLFAKGQSTRRPRVWAHNVPRAALFEALEGCHWLHFAGHARVANGRTCWQLADGPFGVEEIQTARLFRWPEFVFAHACASAREDSGEYGVGRSVQSMAEAFLSVGVRYFLGTAAPVLDEACLKFAEDVYRQLLAGRAIGIALQVARQQFVARCGPHNLLWACYMLFGDPASVLLPAGGTASSVDPRLAISDSDAGDSSTEEIALPAACTMCGKIIKTRHGIGAQGVDGVTCRACARGVRSDSANSTHKPNAPASEFSGKAGTLAGASGLGVQSDLVAEEGRRREVNFIGRFSQVADRFLETIDPSTGRRHSVNLVLLRSGAAESEQSEFQFRTPASLPTQRPRNEYRGYELHGFQPFTGCSGRLRITVRVVCPEVPATKREQAAVTVGELMALLDQNRNESPAVPHLLMLASIWGWSSEAREYAGGTTAAAFYDPKRAVVLFDLDDGSIVFRRDDLRLKALLPLFDLEDDSAKVARVVHYVRDLLPLETSLGANLVAHDLSMPGHLVETAFRILTQDDKLDLDLDHMDEFGLVIFQRQT